MGENAPRAILYIIVVLLPAYTPGSDRQSGFMFSAPAPLPLNFPAGGAVGLGPLLPFTSNTRLRGPGHVARSRATRVKPEC